MNLNKKVAFVTGSSIGLGKGLIEELSKNDCNVVIGYNNSKEKAEWLKKYIEEMIVSDKNVNEIVQKLVAEKIFFNEYEDRLHIGSNSKARITLTDQGLYMINCESMEKPNVDEVYIEYKDLFGKKYKDYVRFTDEKAIVIYDNEVIEGD